MDLNKLLNTVTLAGKLLLESGAEIYRVEDTITRISLAFGVDNTECFIIPAGIIVSVTKNNKVSTRVRRVNDRGIDLNTIDKINTLSRRIQHEKMSFDELEKELKTISKGKRYSISTIIICSAIGAGCCAYMFGGTIKDFIAAAIIGIVIKRMSLLCSKLQINNFFVNSLSGAIAALLGVAFVYLNIASNLDKTIIGSIMLLVPGLAITNAVRDTIAGDFLSGLTKASEAILVAISIAIGTGAVLSIFMDKLVFI